MFQINREGLKITCDQDAIPSRGSVNVPITITAEEDEYSDYAVQIHCSYFENGILKEVIIENNTIPSQVFNSAGYIAIALALSKDNVILKTNQIVFKIEMAPNGVIVLPDEQTWQGVVQEYVNSVAEDALIKIQEATTQMNTLTQTIQEKLDNGEFVGPTGPTKLQDDNGIVSFMRLSYVVPPSYNPSRGVSFYIDNNLIAPNTQASRVFITSSITLYKLLQSAVYPIAQDDNSVTFGSFAEWVAAGQPNINS